MIVEERNFISIWPTIQSYVQQCIQRILEEQKSTDTVNFVCWNYLVCVCKSSVFAEMHKNHIKKEILNMIKSYINMNCLRNPFSKPNIPNDRISQAFWRELTSNAECAIWQCIEYYLRNEKDEIIIDYLEKNSMHFLETGSSKAIVFLFKCLHHVLPRVKNKMCINEELFTAVVEESWKICLELKKNELFKQAIEAFIYMTYSPITMILPSFKMLDVNKKLLIESGETSSFIIFYLIEHCTKIWSDNPSCLTNNLEILCAALTYGPIHRKDQRIVNDAIAYIESFKNDVSVNQLIQPVNNIMVRITAIKFLRRLLLSITEYQRFPIEIVLLLLNQDKQISSTKARHFGNSLIHRTKTRIWQIIILLEPFLTEENCKQLLKEIYSLLVNENHQPSVRYFLEWTVVRIIYHYPTLEKEFTVYFHKAIEKRIGSIVSFISILIHLISVTSEQNLQEFIQTWIREIIPWTMGQNFNTRIYAQLAVQKFMKVCQANKFENILKNYKPVFDGIRMIDNGNVSKNSQKLLTDFYFQVFNPIEHYTMETIFYDLPRLSSLSDEEWIPPHHFDHRLEKFTPNDELKAINCYNANSDLKDFKISEWVLRTSDCLANENQAESDEINNVTNFQKKITPWKQIIPDSETIQEIQTRKQWNNDGLIIVASLIDKTPNLGGLCRTCEVFAVSEYILGSLKYIEDKQFQNLCVTANKWVSIKEVKPHNLKEYLLEMRQEEYTLIGVEQTDNSQSLENFKFPKKSLLLLGNEKEGIPVDLIHLLDVCVEIPQQGIIRSLNVHVSGAILIWEYARQHNLVST
ncbi:probable methyltransferase TARBP1 isoform X1 [Centruroides sculpturatus]|uniref:probable methyltransferase TARBP1 isoform X1 n=2 Tax=Centruroides sculpturatus TaxID=218467 RepID=UPI000C6DA029|nr:probable methyltransferase TARBP1 isoform X1 [Centruroides sculpturatus]